MGTPFTSARNGLWDASDVDTWGQGAGVYPQTAGDMVNIGHTVTYNKVSTTELGAITINNGGILTFSTSMSTKLTLGHQDIQINSGGELRVGASGAVIPYNYTAELVWNTTGDNTKGINLAAGGKLTVYGDPTYYGSKYDYLVATQVVIPAATNSVTVTVTGNHASKFSAGQELLIHKGGTYASYTNDFARLAVVSAANNGANTDISCTVTERPAALTCLVGADVLNVSRNVLLYKLGYNANLSQVNSNRPRITSSNASTTNNINLSDCVLASFTRTIQSQAFLTNRIVIRNTDSGLYFITACNIDAIIFSVTTALNTVTGCKVSGKIVNANNCINGGFNSAISADIFGCNNAVAGAAYGQFSGNIYSNNYANYGCSDTIFTGSIGFDAAGVAKGNTYDFDFHINSTGSQVICQNAKIPDSPVFYGRNNPGYKGRVRCEHHQRVVNAHYIYDVMGDLQKVLADGSSSRPSQRSGGSQYVEQVTPQANCGASVPCGPASYNYLEIFNVRVWAAAGVAKTYTFYIQNSFGKTLNGTMLKLYADYLDNNPAGSGHLSTVDSGTSSITNRANQADWTQSISVTVTPQADGWVNLYLRLTDGTNANLWVDPLMVIS